MLPEKFRHRVAAIAADHRSGAEELATRAAEALGEFSRTEPPKETLLLACRELVMAQPAMAPMVNLSNAVLWAIERGESPDYACDAFADCLRSLRTAVSAAAAEMYADGMTLITVSASRAVSESVAVAARQGKRLKVICAESRPLREGVEMARQLSAMGVEVTVVADAAIYSMMDRVELAVSGADAISTAGVVNKIGTAALALAARERGRQFCVLCGRQKFVPHGYTLPPEGEKPPAELLEAPAPGIRVVNHYFERTPLHLVTGILTEQGIISPREVRNQTMGRVHPALPRHIDTPSAHSPGARSRGVRR